MQEHDHHVNYTLTNIALNFKTPIGNYYNFNICHIFEQRIWTAYNNGWFTKETCVFSKT